MKTTGFLPAVLATCVSALLRSGTSVAAPRPIFDGKTLDGWEGDADWWRVEAGEIRGGSFTRKVPANFFLATTKSYQNFELKLELRLTGTGFVNSGIQIRSIRLPKGTEMSGYQIDYGPGWYGKLYDESRRSKVIADSVDPQAVAKAVRPEGWNEYRILAEGPRIRTWINGVPALDYTEQDPSVALDGQIAIQIHSGGMAEIQARNIQIEELPPTPNVPTWESIKKNPPKPAAASAPGAAARKDISYNDVQGVRHSAEEELKLLKPAEGFEVELFAKESEGIGKFVMLVFDQQGRAWSSTAVEYPVDANENPAAAEALYASKARDKVLVFDRPFQNGPRQPRVFADGLAIPLGVLPFQNGALVQHGHDVVFLRDTDGDGRSDRREVLLTGFGIQDSHLFPHQFTRAPWGWFWLAQGAFNRGEVRTTKGDTIDFPSTRMARFRPDGSFFEPTSTGPCNIWGLALTGEGEAFIQEANDYGYPVMPFHEYAWYPGCADRLAKSYQPPFPVQAPEFKMGGTGLSGLALSDPGVWPKGSDGVMYVANPITSRINAVRQVPDGPRYKLEKLPDLLSSEDPFFRPVAMTMGPDGCLYIVDWYNKIISHNEVARNHPDRDKASGRIWRVKPKGFQPREVPDYTRLSSGQLLARLGSPVAADAHLAWQTLADRKPEPSTTEALLGIVRDPAAPAARRIQALWTLGWQKNFPVDAVPGLLQSKNRNVRREAVSLLRESGTASKNLGVLRPLANDPDTEVRAAAIKTLGEALPAHRAALAALLDFAKPSLEGPLAPGRTAGKLVKVNEAYERDFERFLVRMYLERSGDSVSAFLTSADASALPVENRIFAALAMDPKTGAPLVASLLPQLQRPASAEELLTLAKSVQDAECARSLQTLLERPGSRAATVEKLLAFRTQLDPGQMARVVESPARALLQGTEVEKGLGAQLVGGFQIQALEGVLVDLASAAGANPEQQLGFLQALQQLRCSGTEKLFPLIRSLAGSKNAALADGALACLLAVRAPEAAGFALELAASLQPRQRHFVLEGLSSSKTGAKMLVASLSKGSVPAAEIDPPVAEKLALSLGESPELDQLSSLLGNVFKPVLRLNGENDAYCETQLALRGPFTVESWVRLDAGIDNNDGLLGAPKQFDLNFFGGKFRAYMPVSGRPDAAGKPEGADVKWQDAVTASKPVTPDLWTHVALTRDADGILRIYQNGELDGTSNMAVRFDFEGLQVGWSGPAKGTKGSIAEFRVWNTARSASEIRANFTRTFAGDKAPGGLTFLASGGAETWKKLLPGAKVLRTTDAPPLLSQAQFQALATKTERLMALGKRGGNVANGKTLAALCTACHTIQGQGGLIGPNLSGAGAMGLEAVIRNIVDPNAAMEAAYRIYRVELKGGELVEAFFVSEDNAAVVVRQPGGADRRIPKSEVLSSRYLRRSLMPEGLLDGFNDDQTSDLLAYLMTLK